MKRRQIVRLLSIVGCVLAVYLMFSYILMPRLWTHYVRRHPALEAIPGVTHTGNGLPGDPLNISLIGSEAELKTIMVAADWYPADPLTLHSCLEIAEASVLKRPYEDAPVSNLFLFDRKQDLAFEKPVDNNPRRRHHVRFWKSMNISNGQPVWVGAAIFDDRVGLNRETGQVTHHTARNIDAERDLLLQDLQGTGNLANVEYEDDFHTVREGKNGGGDPWTTDGRLVIGVLKGK